MNIRGIVPWLGSTTTSSSCWSSEIAVSSGRGIRSYSLNILWYETLIQWNVRRNSVAVPRYAYLYFRKYFLALMFQFDVSVRVIDFVFALCNWYETSNAVSVLITKSWPIFRKVTVQLNQTPFQTLKIKKSWHILFQKFSWKHYHLFQ